MPYILALDQGTTTSRAIVFDERAEVLSAAEQELTQSFPRTGWVEHDPVEIWESQLAVARTAAADSGAERRASQRSASPTSARRPSCGSARPVARCTRPSSGRTGAPLKFCSQLERGGHGGRIHEPTRLVIDP